MGPRHCFVSCGCIYLVTHTYSSLSSVYIYLQFIKVIIKMIYIKKSSKVVEVLEENLGEKKNQKYISI